jgi:hypothetical protein
MEGSEEVRLRILEDEAVGAVEVEVERMMDSDDAGARSSAKVVIHTLTLSPEINLVDQEHNEALNNGCEMLLGADGTLVCPEIPFALQNLRLGGDWLDKSLKAASTGQLRTSRLYMRGTAKAIDRATRLIDKKVKPNRRTAVLKIPSYLKAADREENLEKKL